MKSKYLFLLFSLLGILFLNFLAIGLTEEKQGTITDIKKSQTKTTIRVLEEPLPLIAFEEISFSLQKGDKILYQGSHDTYFGQEQIIIEKLELLK